MSMATLLWPTSPLMRGLPSSPLNPHSHHGVHPVQSSSPLPGSSSPVTSPTGPGHAGPSQPLVVGRIFGPPSSPLMRRHSASTTRYAHARPHAKRSSTSGISSASAESFGKSPSSPMSIEGTTPLEGAMWRQTFSRRAEERDRRRKARQQGLDKRRSMPNASAGGKTEEEIDRQAEADDEEIYRRMILHQRHKEDYALLHSYEQATGGSDPALADIDFWDDADSPPFPSPTEPSSSAATVRPAHLTPIDEDHAMSSPHAGPSHSAYATPPRWHPHQGRRALMARPEESEEDRWAREAAEAEQAEFEAQCEGLDDDLEFEAEEAEMARQVEEQYYRHQGQYAFHQPDHGGPGAFDSSSAMDIE